MRFSVATHKLSGNKFSVEVHGYTSPGLAGLYLKLVLGEADITFHALNDSDLEQLAADLNRCVAKRRCGDCDHRPCECGKSAVDGRTGRETSDDHMTAEEMSGQHREPVGGFSE